VGNGHLVAVVGCGCHTGVVHVGGLDAANRCVLGNRQFGSNFVDDGDDLLASGGVATLIGGGPGANHGLRALAFDGSVRVFHNHVAAAVKCLGVSEFIGRSGIG